MAKKTSSIAPKGSTYVRHRFAGSFVDHESKLHVHGDKIALLESPQGQQTRQFLMAGGLVKCSQAEIEKAFANDKVMSGDSFERKTKIVFKKGKDSQTGEDASVPVEVPLTASDIALVDREDDDEDEDTDQEDDDVDGDDDGEDDEDEDNTPAGTTLADMLGDTANPSPKPKKDKKPVAATA